MFAKQVFYAKAWCTGQWWNGDIRGKQSTLLEVKQIQKAEREQNNNNIKPAEQRLRWSSG
jgi:hypothetical protein